jgi:ferrous iron transport protein A
VGGNYYLNIEGAMIKKLPSTTDRLNPSLNADWGFTFLGGNLEREALPTYGAEDREFGETVNLEPSVMPLAKAQVGDRRSIVRLRGNHHTIQHLHHMGFCPGAEVQVISRSFNGSVIVTIGDTRLGLGARMAQQVMVSTPL